MSQALKCDRCKTCFDPYEQTELCAGMPEITLFDGKSMSEHHYIKRYVHLNFCPTCTKFLMDNLNPSMPKNDSQ